jgi:hypothetical protein
VLMAPMMIGEKPPRIKRSGTWQQTKAVAMDYGEGSSQHTTEQATKRVRGEDRSPKASVQKKPKNGMLFVHSREEC